MNNPVIDAILSRRSVRKYTAQKPSEKDVETLLHAAMSAPSGVNRQPWEFVIVDDPQLLASLAEALPYAKMTAEAPVAILACGNKERFLDGADSTLWVEDLAAASENLQLAAHALGLGSVWTAVYPHSDRMEAVALLLHLPDSFVPYSLMPVGYPADSHEPVEKWHPDRVHRNAFG